MSERAPTRVFLAVSNTDALSPALLTLLSDAERLKAGKIRGLQRRNEYSCGRVLLRLLLQEVTGLPADRHVISSTHTGKPVCEDGPGVSIAHSKGLIACAAAITGEVGIDIECSDSGRDTRWIAEQCFSATEHGWLETQPRDRFYMLWVLKEAWLKAIGSGISGGLDRGQYRIDPPSIEVRLDCPIKYSLSLFEMSGAYVGLAVTESEHREISLLQLEPGNHHLTGSSVLRKIASGDSYGGASPS